jgi:hypothetical protein
MPRFALPLFYFYFVKSFHKHLIKHVGGVVMTKCTVKCIKFSSPNGHNSGKTQCTRITTNVHIFILGKLGIYLVLKRIWNPIDFQGQRSRSPGQIVETISVTISLHNFIGEGIIKY